MWIRNMGVGFRIGQGPGNPAGTVSATLTNNTVDGSRSDAVALNASDGEAVTVTMRNNLRPTAGGGISVPGRSPEAR
jgi:hypothetical protein